jgi:hypothetical protein
MMERNRDGRGASSSLGGCCVSHTMSVEEVDELIDTFISRFYNNNNLFLRSQPSHTSNWCIRPPLPSDLLVKSTEVYIPYPPLDLNL